ncbi:hypothetical protein ST47_g9255 [Ascochyta rabiei]|uniref:Uncharacterized protein n=1 Tax=Didymella rabiei TaxID=5454 RepID=A0A162XXI4_DIDRA|nr:hypothetical protein ST47_g9255 [Ascochyta rabiei]
MSTHTGGSLPEQHDSPYSQTSYTGCTPVQNQAYTSDQESLHPHSYANQHGPSTAPPANAVSAAPEKPRATKPTLEAHISQPPSPTDFTAAAKPHLLSQRHDFLVDWTLKILGVASAILFGIWAPISYKITADSNAGNDASQASLMSEISSMRNEAATAASAQRSIVSALAKVQNQLDNAGLIKAFEFCSDRTDSFCADLTASASISEALSSLGGLSGTLPPPPPSSAPIATSTSSPESGSSKGGVSSENLLAIILGSVFSAIVVIGLVVGILTKKRQQRKLIEES